jgi:hypothetical protein
MSVQTHWLIPHQERRIMPYSAPSEFNRWDGWAFQPVQAAVIEALDVKEDIDPRLGPSAVGTGMDPLGLQRAQETHLLGLRRRNGRLHVFPPCKESHIIATFNDVSHMSKGLPWMMSTVVRQLPKVE